MKANRKPRRRFDPLLPFRALIARPRLVGGIAVGVLTAVALTLFPHGLRGSTRAIFAWDSGCAWFILFTLLAMGDCDHHHQIRQRAAAQDEGRGLILGLVLVAACMSIGAIAGELSLAKNDHGLMKILRIGLAFGTVVVSWFVVQLIFALHYAHEFYTPEAGAPAAAGKPEGVRGGLQFPDDDTPDYWDFLYASVIIGVAAQTADVTFTRKQTRRIGTVHGSVAFIFNTVVLALTINLVAGLL